MKISSLFLPFRQNRDYAVWQRIVLFSALYTGNTDKHKPIILLCYHNYSQTFLGLNELSLLSSSERVLFCIVMNDYER